VLLDRDTGHHLTYCTNIHPGDGWAAVDANIRRYAPALKASLSPTQPFGLGLRLSARDARELLEGRHLDDLHAYLVEAGLYVALINGFPYGPFHGTPVKANVYTPDWREDARVEYTRDLIRILSRLLPRGVDGGVSTAPLTYKPWMLSAGADAMQVMTLKIARVAAALVEARRDHGVFIHLDIEPEPDCLLETTAETVDFFEQWLLPVGGPALAAGLGLTLDEAQGALLAHVQVCFDCCHFAVEYEDPADALERLRRAGIRVGRVQLSSAIDVALPSTREGISRIADRLRPFADATYLHQVIERRGSALRHFPDLKDALNDALSDSPRGAGDKEWRIHFHVPLFTDQYEGLGSTQGYVRRVLEAAAGARFSTHLEIETYTWDVLPGDLKIDLLESIRREYEWVLSTYRASAGR
jgi:sugar phosphate isomerase/epimerase